MASPLAIEVELVSRVHGRLASHWGHSKRCNVGYSRTFAFCELERRCKDDVRFGGRNLSG